MAQYGATSPLRYAPKAMHFQPIRPVRAPGAALASAEIGGKTMDFRNVLFPVDFSERCRAAVPYVEAMARLFDSSVFLLHVSENPGSRNFELRPAPESARALAEMARAGFEGLTVVPAVRQGDPATEI